jgi:hypothetical protein
MRIRYWHLTIAEVINARYPIDKVNHWEIKCLYGNINILAYFGINMALLLTKSLFMDYVFTIMKFQIK